jgi:hypothetical protein
VFLARAIPAKSADNQYEDRIEAYEFPSVLVRIGRVVARPAYSCLCSRVIAIVIWRVRCGASPRLTQPEGVL